MKAYQRVVDYIEQRAAQGAWQHNRFLPSVRALSQSLGVSKNTVLHAYQLLEAKHVIRAVPRRGFELVQSVPAKPHPPRPVVLGATALDIIGPAQREARVVFGSANPDTTLNGRKEFFKTLSRAVRRETQSSDAIYTFHESPPGLAALREQIALRTHSGTQEIDKEEVIITNGAQEAISLALRVVTSPGDNVIVESPCFYGTLQCLEALELHVIEIPSDAEGICLHALESALKSWSTKAIVLNPNANNPTGFIMPEANKRRLLALANQYDLAVIEDDVFGSLIHHSQRNSTLKALDTDGRVMLCNSFSKILDPSLRLGWIAAGRYFDQVNYLKYVTTLATSGIMQHAAADWLSSANYPRHLKHLQGRYRQKRCEFLDALANTLAPEVQVIPPQGGFLCWLQLPETCDGDRIYLAAKEHGISLTPGSLFGTQGQFKHCIRLNFALFNRSCEQMQALERVGQLITEAT